jgi:NAD+ synthetase
MEKITYSETVKNLRGLLKDYIVKSNLKSLVIGISGGIDSALVSALAKPVVDELGIPLIGRSISIQSNKEDEEERARQIGNLFCTDFEEVDLSEEYIVLRNFDDMEGPSEEGHNYKIRMGNIKARMRMMYLYNIASKYNGLVLSTDNMTELLLGFWTLHGDVGDYGLIQELWKTEVYDMTEWLSNNEGNTETKNALMSTVTGNATDGLGISSTDLDQILPDWKNRHQDTRGGYSEVDNILIDYITMVDKLMNMIHIGQEYITLSDNIMILSQSPVVQRHLKSQFKRENPYNEKREKYIVY